MMRNWFTAAFLLASIAVRADGPADNIADKVRPVPPAGARIAPEVRAELQGEAARLRDEVAALRKDLKSKPALVALLPDVEIYAKAVDWAVRFDEIFNPTNEIPAARALLKQGFDRARQLREGAPLWTAATGLVVRAYVSKLDGSIQPYGLVVPASYRPDNPQVHRLDIWFHGRDEKLSELNFINGRQKSPGEFTPRDTIVLHTYGRYCNGQKLAGEVDLFEALAEVRKFYRIDENRIVVRGFSLGGAACWQIAAHFPSEWAAAAPGAGFSETPEFLKVFQQEQVQPAWYEQKLWHQYNATDYALNFFNLPVVAYSGEIDSQRQAAEAMAKAMNAEGLELTHIIGPQTKHSYHPTAKVEVSRRIDAIAQGGRIALPRQVRFTTWTLRYNKSAWVTVDQLQQHWDRARVSADLSTDGKIDVRTENVTALTLSFPSGQSLLDVLRPVEVTVDGVKLVTRKPGTDRSWEAQFHKEGNAWALGPAGDKALSKRHELQGPIDDAFMGSFLVVRPTGTAANEKFASWAAAELAHFTNEWRRQFRGDARVKDDSAVSDSDVAEHNLILWGDPASNRLLAKVLPSLPVSWDAQQIKLGGKSYSSATNSPVLIYPNPLNSKRYVVINSGFTIREYDYLNNARQVPKLPDWAVLDLTTPPTSRWPGKVVDAGFFDDHWKLAESPK